MTETLDRTENILSRYAAMGESSVRGLQGPIRDLKEQALQQFLKEGFPTTRQEDWRFTNTAALARAEFLAPEPSRRLSESELSPFLLDRTDHFVFINGSFSRELSSTTSSIELLFFPLQELLRQNALAVGDLGKHASLEGHPFTALNTALFTDGAFIRVSEGVVLERPIHLLFVSTGGDKPYVSHPRVLIVAEPGSQMSVIESYVSLSEGPYWTNGVTEISLGSNARLDHYRLQQDSEQAFHTGRLQALLDRDSHLTTTSLSLGAGLARQDIGTKLSGVGSACVLNGLYLVHGKQHVDHHTIIDHATPHSDSEEFYKGILDEQGRGVFDGKIIVRKDAQKTNSGQVSRSLLLSASAIADTKPQLEIYADDVKCTHGSTIGQLDEAALFYLRTRGIGEKEARTLLIHGFASEVLERIKVPSLRLRMERAVLQRLPADVNV